MSNFRDEIKVSKEEINTSREIIKKLNEQEQVYNPNTLMMSDRTNFLRSGENVFYNMMLISGLLFSLNDTSKNIIDASIIGRVKSPESITKKETRKGRENKINGDIIAYNIIIDRIHNSDDFYNVFRSNKVQSLYNERKSNIDLMQMVVDFINSFEMYGISSELDETLTDEETKKISKSRLENMKESCIKVAENIEKYNKEDPSNANGIPVNQAMRIMCEELLEKEISNAINGLYSEKKQLEKNTKKEISSEEMIQITKNNLRIIKSKIKILETKKNWKTEELVEILSGKIDKERVMLYIPIIEQLKKEEFDALISKNSQENDESNEKKYCKLLMLVLYQLTKLEFVKEGQYEGLVYNNIVTNLHNLLKEYKNCEINKGTYGNVTFESLQKLTTNLIRLNARLSDQLQFEIAKYEMEYYLKPIIMQYTDKEDIIGDEKVKPNGYVSIHYDIGNFEIKLTTRYRDRVASKGSAAYGSGRIDNKNEKKREIKRLSYKKYDIKPTELKDIPIIKNAKVNLKLAKKISEIKTLEDGKDMYLEYGEQYKLKCWRRELLKSTPRYFVAKYEKDMVKIEFLGALENVEKYYSETSVIQIRDEVKTLVQSIKKQGEQRVRNGKEPLLSNEPYVIEISRDQYHNFINYELKNLKMKVKNILSETENFKQNDKNISR